MGQRRADEGVVPEREAEAWSWSRRGSKPGGRRQRWGSKTDVDWSGRGYWEKTETIADVDAGTGTETKKAWKLRLETLERLGDNTEVITVQSSKHNWTQWGFVPGETGCA